MKDQFAVIAKFETVRPGVEMLALLKSCEHAATQKETFFSVNMPEAVRGEINRSDIGQELGRYIANSTKFDIVERDITTDMDARRGVRRKHARMAAYVLSEAQFTELVRLAKIAEHVSVPVVKPATL